MQGTVSAVFVGMAFCLPLSLLGGLFDDKKKEGFEDSASLQQRLLSGGQDHSQDEQNKTSIRYAKVHTIVVSLGLLCCYLSVST